ncbi:DUF460 domain-containing protein [Pyrofollis japonicus]|nr:DUF460 domain-containing protein [Pyrofollis japonicus]
MRVMGLDIEPGCRSSSRCFSLVLLEDDRLVAKYESIPLHRVIRIVWEHRPSVIALDNLYELASDEHELIRVVSMLPPNTEIVQVTRLPTGEYVDIRSLAKLAGIDVGSGKLSPSRTAYVAALLVLKGYGSKVRFVEEKTRIIVSKSRRLKHGGSSNPRFQRKVRSAILRAVKLIKHKLDRNRFDYDLVFRKSSGGLESATFIVYAPRDRLYGIIKPYEDSDIRIEIKPVYSSQVVFETKQDETLQGSLPYIIVGVDPGISTGLAALDINGNFVAALSRRGLDRGDVIAWIQSHGVPVLVATDVRPAPDFVKKLAASLGVPLYEPPVSLSVEEKREIVEAFAKKYPEVNTLLDTHVRDALAAALRAFNSYKSKLQQVESYVSKIGIEMDLNHIKAEVIKGVTIAEAVENAINRVLKGIEPQAYLVKRVRKQSEHYEDKQGTNIVKLKHEIEILRAQNKLLEQKIKELNERLELIEKDYRVTLLEYRSDIEKDREIARLTNALAQLRNELEKVRKEKEEMRIMLEKMKNIVMGVASGALIPGLYLGDIGNDSIDAVREIVSNYGKTIIILDRINPVNWAHYGSDLKDAVLAVLAPSSELDKRSAIEQYDIPVLPIEQYRVEVIDSLAFVDELVISDAYARLQEIILEKKNRNKRKELSLDDLKKLFAEYRERRAKLFSKNS